jgi:DNA-binding IclR family transcriptional regulator
MRMTRTAVKPTTKRPAAKAASKSALTAKSKPSPKLLKQSEAEIRKAPAKPAGKAAAAAKTPAAKLAVASAEAAHPRDPGLVAVDQTLALLDVLARISPAPTAALEREVGCSRAAALRLLAALQGRGFVIHDEADDAWQLGPRWDVLRRAAHSQGALAAASMPFLTALGKATGENVYLRVRDGQEGETIAVYQADPVLRVYTEAGKRSPLHAGPARLLLAHAPESVQTQVLSQRLPRFTPATRTDPTWIAADLQRLRARGYLITADEVNAGAASVSAPVRDASGQVIAVLILSAPSMRLKPPRPRQLLPQVLDAAAQLSRALGGPAGQVMTVPAANGGPLPASRSAASIPTAPASPAAWGR